MSTEPSLGLLMSMAIRYDHALGMPGYYDTDAIHKHLGVTHRQRLESTIGTMRQLWQETAGQGFWSPEQDLHYRELYERSLGKA